MHSPSYNAHPTARELTLKHEGFSFPMRVLGRKQAGCLPILFVGGAFQTMDSWRKFADYFAPRTLVLLADLPGTGTADLLPRHYGLDFLASSARHVLDVAGVEQAYVVAASYGSPIAYRLAQTYPQRVARLVLAGVMKEIPAEVRGVTEETVTLLGRGDTTSFAKLATAHLLSTAPGIERGELARRLLNAQLARLSPDQQARYVENTARLLQHAPLDLAHPPTAPALVFTGEHDIYTPPAACREVAAALPDAHFTRIERADHLFHLERFDVTLSLVEAFERRDELAPITGCAPFERFRAAGIGSASPKVPLKAAHNAA
jgi:pimeloyl-ACP methyl ester carboxylesterase